MFECRQLAQATAQTIIQWLPHFYRHHIRMVLT